MRELSLNILDVVGNSTKAGAKKVAIRLLESTTAHTLEILIEDNGQGMDAEFLKTVTDPFTTSRTTRKVGLGIPLFKMAAEQTGGHFTILSEKGVGTKVVAFFHTNHLDCVPLGDMGATLFLLISGSPDTDFIYTQVRDGVETTLSTVEIRALLGEVPLDNPEVMQWLSEYLKELLGEGEILP